MPMAPRPPASGRTASEYLDGAYTGSMPYTGETNSKGERHGQGTMTFASGNTYTGELEDGEIP